ncbi:MAG: NADH-quinone oxidoreductase subunit NuoK [Nitrososphaerales archaeon]
MEPLINYITLSAILFGIGVYGLVSKRNALRLIFSVEIIINAAILNLVTFSTYSQPPTVSGQTFALFAIAVAAAEVAVGLAIIMVAFRLRSEIDVLDLKKLKG